MKLRRRRPAPTSSTMAAATCTTISPIRAALFRQGPDARKFTSFKDRIGLVCEYINSGNRPNRTPVRSETTRVKLNTDESKSTCSIRGESLSQLLSATEYPIVQG